jgi:hypothetical protein
LADASAAFAQALVDGREPKPMAARVDYDAVLKLATAEVQKSEQLLAARRRDVTEAESQLQLARASEIYSELLRALAPLVSGLPTGLVHPSSFDRLLTVRVQQDHVMLVVHRPAV